MKFLESEIVPDKDSEDKALFHVIPAPMELSVSYKGGTSKAPQAIIEASDQLEAWDYSQSVAVIRESGIYTDLLIECKGDNPEIILENIETRVLKTLSSNKIKINNNFVNAIPVLLGGEHTVTLGALRALKKHFSQNFPDDNTIKSDRYDQKANFDHIQDFGIIQIDAHADLRDSYQGNRLSHACVMRRAVDELSIPLFQIGVRAISKEEFLFRQKSNIQFIDAREIYLKGAENALYDNPIPANFPKKIYITLDVDGLDPSVIRATGTPVPGGISWYDTMILLEKIISRREVIGFDVVELSPIKDDHASDFAAAQLVYSVMGMIQKYGEIKSKI